MKTFTFILAFLFVLSACSSYSYKPKPVPESKYPGAIEKAKKDKRYFIFQSGINIYTITSVDLDQAKQQMTVTLDKVDSLHLSVFKNPEMMQTKALDRGQTLQPEIRVYMKDSISYTMDEPHTIPLEKVARVELLGKS